MTTTASIRADEVRLVGRAVEGDHDAFAELVGRYQGAVHALAYRMLGRRDEADDAAQEIFLKVYRQLARYDRERPFSTWVLAIGTHHCIDKLRRRRLTLVPLDSALPWARSREAEPERAAAESDEATRLRACVGRLPERYRAVLVLYYWHDHSIAEIGTTLGIPEGTVKTQLHRARKALAALLVDEEAQHAHAGV